MFHEEFSTWILDLVCEKVGAHYCNAVAPIPSPRTIIARAAKAEEDNTSRHDHMIGPIASPMRQANPTIVPTIVARAANRMKNVNMFTYRNEKGVTTMKFKRPKTIGADSYEYASSRLDPHLMVPGLGELAPPICPVDTVRIVPRRIFIIDSETTNNVMN